MTRAEILSAIDNVARSLVDIKAVNGAYTQGLCREIVPRGPRCPQNNKILLVQENTGKPAVLLKEVKQYASLNTRKPCFGLNATPVSSLFIASHG
ncbi:MAG: hypothetical protein SWO11_16460 [Thermodesulfobacteriota bacterium]|nr:hypothetical protein [Thermodesulfobacteriota bacterium]